jgi:hypothetical protein
MELIYHKTEKGTEALKTRGKDLPQKLRTMLILIDGTKSVRELLPAAAILGMDGNALAMLAQQGLIKSGSEGIFATSAPVQSVASQDIEFARFRSALAFMTEIVADALGVRAFFLR